MAGRIAARVGLALLVAMVLLVIGALAIDTAPGRGLVARLAQAVEPANGLRFSIGRIDGSIYRRMTLRDIVVRDAQGVVATVPAVTVDWHPGALLGRRVAADLVEADRVDVLRRPVLRPTPPSPWLPDIDIFVGRFSLRRLVLAAPVTGTRQVLAVEGDADIADGRARINGRAVAGAGGDRLSFRLDAVPDADRFAIDGHLIAPVGGVVDGLARLDKPLTLDLGGSGSWAAWRGRADARLGSDRLLGLALTANGGRFTARGTVRPGLVAPAAARLTDPELAVDATVVAADRRLETRLRLTSPALDVVASGLVDLGAGRYAGVKIDATLLRPAAVLDGVSGREVRAALVLDGPFATPTVDYTGTAAALGFGATGVEHLRASGVAVVDATRIRLPLHATAARITGVDAAVGGLLGNVRLDGDLAVTAKQIASDNLRLRSDRIDATVVLAASLATGEYTAALRGRVNRYAVAGVGIVDLVTDARLVPAGKGQFRVRGNVRATTVRIDNPSVRDFLGGDVVATAVVDRSPDGLISVGALRATAPKFRLASGAGSYRGDGRVAFVASGSQAQYGPLRLAVSGTLAKPVVTLRAARPNVGVALGDVEAVLRPAANGYAVTATGNSPYGRFAADVGLGVGTGPLSVEVRRASLAGLVVSGRIAATAAGPYVGTLALTGPGLTGTVRLSASGAVQRADLALDAANARVPLPEPLLIGRGTASLTAILYPNAPQISGSGRFTGVRRGTLSLAHLTASGNYAGGSGRLDLTADGESGVPFAVAANAGFAPGVVRVAASAKVNGVALRLAAPAEIRRERRGYRLSPATIVLPGGSIAVSGVSGAATELTASLEAVDLSIVDAVKPGLGLGGKASGRVDFTLARGGVPTGHAAIRVSRFSRAGVTSLSAPVDIALQAHLSPAGASADAVLRRAGAVLGRVQARLAPLPGTPADSWSERLLAAPLAGGIRYNGPAEQLWALTGIAGQQVSGPIAIGADFSGQLGAPGLRGVIRGKGLRYENSAYGTVVDQVNLDSRFVDTRLEIVGLTGRAGGGSVTAGGYADLAADKGFPIDLRIRLDKARLARSSTIDGTLSGDLAVTNSAAKGALITGRLDINQARYAITRLAAAEVVELDGVRRKNAPAAPAAPPPRGPSVFKLAIDVHARNEIFVSGMGLEAEWRTDLKIGGTANAPQITGTVDLVRGTYGFGGRSFALSRGIVRFAGEIPYNPVIDIEATTAVAGLTAIIDITGRAFAPEIAFTSTPALAQDEVLSRLLFGSSIESLTPIQALQLAASLNTLRGSGGGGFNPLGTLRKATGIDRLRIVGGDTANGQGSSLAAGKYIGNRIYVEVTTDSHGYALTQLEIALSRTLRLLSTVSSFGGSNISLRYAKDY